MVILRNKQQHTNITHRTTHLRADRHGRHGHSHHWGGGDLYAGVLRAPAFCSAQVHGAKPRGTLGGRAGGGRHDRDTLELKRNSKWNPLHLQKRIFSAKGPGVM